MTVFSDDSGDAVGTVMLTLVGLGGLALESNMIIVMPMSAETSKRMIANGVMRKWQ